MMRENGGPFLIVAILAFTILTLSAANSSSSLRAELQSSAVQQAEFTVVVNRNGFNGTLGAFNITVHQGDLVKITFVYGDTDLPYNNPHKISIEDYNIHTDQISKSNPTVTVRFTADQAGTFSFYCTIYCIGMDKMQSGNLNVIPR